MALKIEELHMGRYRCTEPPWLLAREYLHLGRGPQVSFSVAALDALPEERQIVVLDGPLPSIATAGPNQSSAIYVHSPF